MLPEEYGKWDNVPAAGGPGGTAMQQQLDLAPWPILEPHCNRHGQPISIIGDLFFESNRVAADVLLEGPGIGAGLALRIRPSCGGANMVDRNFRGNAPGLYLYMGATPGVLTLGPGSVNPGGVRPAPNVLQSGRTLCQDSSCLDKLASGAQPSGAKRVGAWHRLSLEVTDNHATGEIDNETIFKDFDVLSPPLPPGNCSGCTPAALQKWAARPGACSGLVLDAEAHDADSCATHCCGDPACTV